MKRMALLAIVFAFVACAPASVPTEAPRPTVNMVIEVASPTATDEPTFTPIPETFTPIPPTFTPTTNFRSVYQVSKPTSISGANNARVLLDGWIPGKVEVSSASKVEIIGVLIDGSRIPFSELVSIDVNNRLVALEVFSDDVWVIEFGEGQAATATKIVATVTRAPARTKAPVIIPTNTRVIVFPTNTPVVVSVPTSPPAQACCKYCDPAKSKPCGDSCISLDKTCHKGPGCACSK